MKKTQSQITYDAIAPFYRQISVEREKYLNGVDNIITTLIKDSKSLVDLGSGDGVRVASLSKKARVNNIVLVDNSDEMLKLSRRIPKVKVVKSSIVNYLPKDKFDVATCLWNVLGHADNVGAIKKTIFNVDRNILKTKGLFILDVNNRYNIRVYGLLQVAKNLISDMLNPSKNRYAEFYKKFDNKKVKMKVHFFTPHEIEGYMKGTCLRVVKKLYVNYETGKIENQFWKGQILYIMRKL